MPPENVMSVILLLIMLITNIIPDQFASIFTLYNDKLVCFLTKHMCHNGR